MGITETFSYSPRETEVIRYAKEIAKRNNLSFSKLVVRAISEYIDEEKKLKALEPEGLPILSGVVDARQSSIDEYTPILYKTNSEREQMFSAISNCNDNKKLTVLAIQINDTRKKVQNRRFELESIDRRSRERRF